MAAKDIITKEYMKDTSVFADAFNGFLFDGEPVVDPARLHAMDTTEIAVPYGEGKTEAPVQKFRDNLKYLTAMTDENAAYLILGIENQTDVHTAMPVKNMVYDALQYAAQVEKAAKSHRKAEKERAKIRNSEGKKEGSPPGPSSKEYLSSFYQDDRLVPVITLVILFSPASWDGPMSIHEMLSVKDKRILSFVPDYKINRIAPAHMDMKDMNKLKTSLREVLLYIKYSKDKEKLKQVVLSDERFKHMERSAASVINAVTNSKIKIDEKEEVIDMCQAIMEMREEERLIGRNEGREEGRAQGQTEEREETAKRMLKLEKYTMEEISICVNLSIERIKELQKAL